MSSSSLPLALKPPPPAQKGYCEVSDDSLERRVPETASEDAVITVIHVLRMRTGLSPRQAEVLHWIAEGKTSSEISQIMELSFNTVKNHTKDIFTRLGVHSRTAAAACAYRAHIAEADALRAMGAKPSRCR